METDERGNSGTSPTAASLSPLQRAILLTVLYADLFDYPLTADEIYHRLIGVPAGPGDFQRDLISLAGPYLSEAGGYFTWRGREVLVALRQERLAAGQLAWSWALRYARWLARIPFVRMIAVSGSLAVDNSGPEADIDLFIITERDRLWISRLGLVLFRVLTRRLSGRFSFAACPNYLVSMSALEIEQQDLYTAHEVIQIVPLWGTQAYTQFLQANEWVRRFLPQAGTGRQDRWLAAGQPAPAYLWERLFPGRLGDALDHGLYRLFLAFHDWVRPLTLRGRTRQLQPDRARFRQTYSHDVRKAFQRNRQLMIGAGYAGIIRQRFAEQVQQRLGKPLAPAEFETLFPPGPQADAGVLHAYTQAFHVRDFKERYGNA